MVRPGNRAKSAPFKVSSRAILWGVSSIGTENRRQEAQDASSGSLEVKKVLRWLAAMTMTWLLSTTILASLVARLGVGSFAFAVLLNSVLPMWILGFFAIADPNLDHPWLAPYLRTRRWEQNGSLVPVSGRVAIPSLFEEVSDRHLWAPTARLPRHP